MTAFGYGKPENFSGYLLRHKVGFDEKGLTQVSSYIFYTTSKYIKFPPSYLEN